MAEFVSSSNRRTELSDADAMALVHRNDLDALNQEAAALRDAGFGGTVTFSRKVFIPLTKLCRDVCHYCTFATTPKSVSRAFMTLDEVLETARAGVAAGCDEALFTLGEKPELRYRLARRELAEMGYDSTLEYLHDMAAAVLKETGLLPHINAGTMSEQDIRSLKKVSASQGLMLETTADRLSRRGGPHYGSPDKIPAKRLETLEAAGRAQVPMTTGLLIGIGETRAERIEALLRIRETHRRHGHIQEVIVQNFCAKTGTRMVNAPEPDLADHQWTIAVARLVLGADMSIQAPPNLQKNNLFDLVASGINDWGGVSPVTPDFVNPEHNWPTLDALSNETAAAGKNLVPRLTVYPQYVLGADPWLAAETRPAVLARADGAGMAHETPWRVGTQASGASTTIFAQSIGSTVTSSETRLLVDAMMNDRQPADRDLAMLFAARGPDANYIRDAADELRGELAGDQVTYVINRNINYTNVCGYRCAFCAFSKGKTSLNLRGRPYDITLGEILRRVKEARDHGATEVCLQGGIHPDYSGETYQAITAAIREAAPDMHIHAFSALEVQQGAHTLNLPIAEYLTRLRNAGLGTLPGTAAEILDDEVRRDLCADKLDTNQWLSIHKTAHGIGIRSTATMMFGHIDAYLHWARHMLRIRSLQDETAGFTEFVPLPFVHMEAPIYRKGLSRQGPSLRETLLVHAIARLVMHKALPNIQVSWVKLGLKAATEALRWGVNDIGGTLMNESISRAAGNEHGQILTNDSIAEIARLTGRQLVQRTTLYEIPAQRDLPPPDLLPPLTQPVLDRAGKYARVGSLAGLQNNKRIST